MTKQQFAAAIGTTVRRVNQLISEGLVTMNGKAIDVVPSLLKLLADAKARRTNQNARARLIEAQVAGAELRSQRQLRRLITVPELADCLSEMIEAWLVMAHGSSAGIFYELAPIHGEATARQTAHRVLLELQHKGQIFRTVAQDLVDRIERDQLSHPDRVSEEFRRLLPKVAVDETRPQAS